jgi:hypothetical protein
MLLPVPVAVHGFYCGNAAMRMLISAAARLQAP